MFGAQGMAFVASTRTTVSPGSPFWLNDFGTLRQVAIGRLAWVDSIARLIT